MDVQDMAQPCNEMLFSNKIEWLTDKYSMHESWKYAKWKKPVTKKTLYCMSLFIWEV